MIVLPFLSAAVGLAVGHYTDSMAGFVVAALVFTGAVPILIAKHRKHPQYWPIAILTIAGAWTGLLWLVALVWSLVGYSKTAESADVKSETVSPPNSLRPMEQRLEEKTLPEATQLTKARYQVVLQGIKPTRNIEVIRDNLCVLFKATPEQIALLMETPNYIVKRGLALDVARQYQAALDNAGAICELEKIPMLPQTLDADLPPTQIPTSSSTVSAVSKSKSQTNNTNPQTKDESHLDAHKPFNIFSLAIGCLVLAAILSLLFRFFSNSAPQNTATQTKPIAAPVVVTPVVTPATVPPQTDAIAPSNGEGKDLPNASAAKASTFTLTDEDKAIVERLRSNPTPKPAVSSTRGSEIFPGVEFHYVVDQYREPLGCQVEFNGTETDGTPIRARKWFLTYYVSPKTSEALFAESFFGPPRDLRMSLDEAEDKIHGIKVGANGQGILGLSPTVLASITQAKSAKILHGFVASDEVSFTYDISLFARARNIALTLCSAN